MLQLTQRFLTKQCPLEQGMKETTDVELIKAVKKRISTKKCFFHSETLHLLSSIYASTGESFGITKTLTPYRDEVLEYFRVKAISFPW